MRRPQWSNSKRTTTRRFGEGITSQETEIRRQDITNIGTYWQTLRPGGILYGEGEVLYITGDGQSAHWKGFGVGRPTGSFPAGHFAVCGSAETESQALGRFNEIATVIEYDVDQEGNYRYTTWEWR
jgi:hypothetical protein